MMLRAAIATQAARQTSITARNPQEAEGLAGCQRALGRGEVPEHAHTHFAMSEGVLAERKTSAATPSATVKLPARRCPQDCTTCVRYRAGRWPRP